MLWCNKKYIHSIDDIIHHKSIIDRLKNSTLNNLQNTIFYGKQGCGKKTIVKYYIKYLIQKKFNISSKLLELEDVHLEFKYKNIIYEYPIKKNNYYHYIDFSKFKKKNIIFFTQFMECIIHNKNIHTQLPQIFIFINFNKIAKNIFVKLNYYFEKYYMTSRFIIITNNVNFNYYLKKNYFYVRIPRITDKIFHSIFKNILTIHYPKKKITLKKTNEIIKYANYNLAKSIFYLQLNYEYGLATLKNIATRDDKIFKELFSIITSNNLKKITNIRSIVYGQIINYESSDLFILKFLRYLIENHASFYKKYNNIILKNINSFVKCYTEKNKTIFIICESFFISLMSAYSCDN